MSLNTTSQTQEAITALDTLVKQNGALLEQNNALIDEASTFAMNSDVAAGKEALVAAIRAKGGTANTNMSFEQLASAINNLSIPTMLKFTTVTFENSANNRIIDMSAIDTLHLQTLTFNGYGSVEKILNFPHTPNLTSIASLFRNCTSLKEFSWGRIDTSNVTFASSLFEGCTSIESVDISNLSLPSNTTYINNLFSNCLSLKVAKIRNMKFYGNCQNMFSGCASLTKIDMIDTDATNAVSFTSIFPSGISVETLVGDETYANVVSNDIKILKGLNFSNNHFRTATLLNQASLRALINGLADRTGQTALTLTIGADLIAKLNADDIAVATNKNWTIS